MAGDWLGGKNKRRPMQDSEEATDPTKDPSFVGPVQPASTFGKIKNAYNTFQNFGRRRPRTSI